MTNNKIELSIIIPVFNEEKSINNVFFSLINQIKKINIEYEIIVVNDGSTDNSKNTLSAIENIKLINHPQNRGYGASLKTGIKEAKYGWILIIDCDNTYPINALPLFIDNTKNYDMIVGSREKKNNSTPRNRRQAKKFLNIFASYIVGKKIPDLNSGLRIFKKDIVLKYWNLFPDRFSFTSTLTMVCLTHGYETKFIPIEYHKRTGDSSIRPVDFLNFLKLVTKLSLFFKPIKIFVPMSLFVLMVALGVVLAYFIGYTDKFFDTTFIILCATALQTLFFGLLAEIVIHNR